MLPRPGVSLIINPCVATLQWNETMPTTAHSDFFGLDLNFGGPSAYTISPEVWAQAQEDLSQWTDLAHRSNSTDRDLFVPHSSGNIPQIIPESAGTQPLTKSPSVRSITDDSSCPDLDSTLKFTTSVPSPSGTKTRPSSTTTPTTTLTDPSLSKVTKSKEFHFVANSDKKTATRLRNTMTSRNLRQSKVSRIAQLEKELEDQLAEAEKWKARALGMGWNGEGSGS